jgi:pimeloyl-ACP methyl ester carboxylesterase
MKYLLVNGLRLEYRELPALSDGRPTLVLLHEGLGSAAMWRQFPGRLAAVTGCRTIVYSRVGYGGSDASPQPRTQSYLHREAEETLPALLAALGIDRPVLIGHSDGGSIALIFASAFPNVPLGVAVMAPHEFIEEETLVGIRAARVAWATTDWPQRLARFHADAEQVFRDWSETWLRPEFRDWNILASLDRIACPVLAMQGVDDEYATLRQVEVIAERVPGAQLLRLPACGHSPHREQESEVLAALEAFIRGLGGADTAHHHSEGSSI